MHFASATKLDARQENLLCLLRGYLLPASDTSDLSLQLILILIRQYLES